MLITHQLYLLAAIVAILMLLSSFLSLESNVLDRAHQFHRPIEFFYKPRGKLFRHAEGVRCQVMLKSASCTINPLVKYWDEVTDCYVSPLRRLHGLQARDHRERRFVVFQPDEGGWNNIRMALEVVVLVAQVRATLLVEPTAVAVEPTASINVDYRTHPGDPSCSCAVPAQR